MREQKIRVSAAYLTTIPKTKTCDRNMFDILRNENSEEVGPKSIMAMLQERKGRWISGSGEYRYHHVKIGMVYNQVYVCLVIILFEL